MIRENENRQTLLPLIVPIIYFNGTEKWRHSLNLADLINAPQPLVDLTLFGDVKLVDLRDIPDNKLRRYIHLGVMNLAMKQIFDEKLNYDNVLVQIKEVDNWPMLKRYLLTYFRYIFSVRDGAKTPDLVKAANKIPSRKAGG